MVRVIKKQAEISSDFIREETNRCVSCGLCLPHCPTYRLLKSEADSPRGRIALMGGVVSGRISLNKRFVLHMDRCLTCRACESVCPNNVAYGQLIDQARNLIAQSEASQTKGEITKQKSKIRSALEEQLIRKPVRFDRMRKSFYFFQKSGLLQWLYKFNSLRKSKLIEQVMKLPQIKFPYSVGEKKQETTLKIWQTVYPAKGKVRGEVGLFLGCVARLTDVATLNSSIFVLNRLGYTVHVPSKQTCCGALHQHSGEAETAVALGKQNKLAFAGFNTIISSASGCGVQLTESCDDSQLSGVIDISKFLITADGWESVDISPLPHKVAIHDPCTLRNVLRDQVYPYQLISLIPDVQVVSLAGNDQCCGAAGTYFMDQPKLANRLLDAKIDAVTDSGASYLLTSNVGCSMHIANGLYGMVEGVEVLHPVTLLARQMGLQL
jgi:glycolate dehydrogenase iron-sulfur subunit